VVASDVSRRCLGYNDRLQKEPSEIATPQLAAELWNRSVAWVGLPA
jgi:hypothetical protein